MIHKEYIKISKDIARQLNEYLEKFCNNKPAFKRLSIDYSKKRVHLNGIQFYAGLNAANSNVSFEDVLDIPIAIECIMLMAYKTNRILDHKQEVWESEEKIKETVLDERIYFTLILRLLENSKKNLGEKFNLVRDLILKMISDINEGFWFEKYFLNYNFSSLSDILKDWDLKYQKRNTLFNSVYDYSTLLGYYVGSADQAIFEKYEGYLEDENKISHSGQIVNDLSDYSSIFDENVKSYQDAFSDIRNGIITLPTYLLINEQDILNALKNPTLTKNIAWRKRVIELLVKNNILEKAKGLTDKSYSKNITFWKEIIGINNELLFFTYLFLSKNKYYLEFIKMKEQNKK